jgi:hypothetical protein
MKNALFASLAIIILSMSVASASEYASSLHDGMRPESDTLSYRDRVSPGDFEALGYAERASTTPFRVGGDSSALHSGMRPEYR